MRQLSHESMQNEREGCFSFLQLVTLRHIKEKNPLMKDVADFLAITPPSATSLVNILTEAGLVSRSTDGSDRRIVRLAITEKGEENLEQWHKKISSHMRKRLEVLDKKEQDDLVRILTKLSKISNN